VKRTPLLRYYCSRAPDSEGTCGDEQQWWCHPVAPPMVTRSAMATGCSAATATALRRRLKTAGTAFGPRCACAPSPPRLPPHPVQQAWGRYRALRAARLACGRAAGRDLPLQFTRGRWRQAVVSEACGRGGGRRARAVGPDVFLEARRWHVRVCCSLGLTDDSQVRDDAPRADSALCSSLFAVTGSRSVNYLLQTRRLWRPLRQLPSVLEQQGSHSSICRVQGMDGGPRNV